MGRTTHVVPDARDAVDLQAEILDVGFRLCKLVTILFEELVLPPLLSDAQFAFFNAGLEFWGGREILTGSFRIS